MTSPVFVFDAVRTPRGKGRPGGGLSGTPAPELQAALITAILERNSIDGRTIADLVLGCVTQVGEQGGNIARVAGLLSNLPNSVPGMSINRYCTSGLDACHIAALKAAADPGRLFLAGGVESMSRVPMLSDKASFYTDPEIIRAAPFVPMGLAADLVASLEGISRAQCDAYAQASQQRAATAQIEGRFDKSLVEVKDRESGRPLKVDESVRGDVTLEKLAQFEPLFVELAQHGYEAVFRAAFPDLDSLDHVHHIGNSPGIVDGASLVLIGAADAGERSGLAPRAVIKTVVNAADDEILALTGGFAASRSALASAGMQASDIDLVEFNESFAAVTVKFVRDSGFKPDQINVNGGAIALGHAMGATGGSLLGTLLDELERQDLSTGLVAVSGAAGLGTAAIIERV